MKIKNFILILGILLIIVNSFAIVSSAAATVQEKTGFFDKIFSSFTGNVVSEGNGIERNGNFISGYKYKDYVEGEEKVIIDDGKGKVLAQIKLISPKNIEVSAGEDIMVAELLFENFDLTSSQKVMNNIEFYDINENMTIMSKTFRLKYFNNENNSASWTEFSKFNELPSKNIRVGLFTDTTLGESVEWIPEMFNFRISEWASYYVTGNTPITFDYSAFGDYYLSSCTLKINNTHFISFYGAYEKAIILYYNPADDSIQNLTAPKGLLPSGTVNGIACEKYNDSLYLVHSTSSGGASGSGRVALFEVLPNLTIITKSSVSTSAAGMYGFPTIERINTGKFLIAYSHSPIANSYYGYARVVNVATDQTLTLGAQQDIFNYNSNFGLYQHLAKVNITHYVLTYGKSSDYGGYAKPLIVNLASDSVTNGTEVGPYAARPTAALHVIEGANATPNEAYFFALGGGWGIGNSAILKYQSNGTIKFGSQFINSIGDALEQVGQNQFVSAGGNAAGNALIARAESVNVPADSISFINTTTLDNLAIDLGGTSIVKIDETHYIIVYTDYNNDDAKAVVVNFIWGTCVCPGLNQNWAIDLTKYCVIDENCDLGTGILSFTGAGYANISARIDTAKVIYPGAGGILYMKSTGRIYVG